MPKLLSKLLSTLSQVARLVSVAWVLRLLRVSKCLVDLPEVETDTERCREKAGSAFRMWRRALLLAVLLRLPLMLTLLIQDRCAPMRTRRTPCSKTRLRHRS